MALLDIGTAAFLLVWGAPFFVAGMLGAWRAAAAIAALPVLTAAWGLLDALTLGGGAERAARIEAAVLVLVAMAFCAALYAAGRARRPGGGGEAA